MLGNTVVNKMMLRQEQLAKSLLAYSLQQSSLFDIPKPDVRLEKISADVFLLKMRYMCAHLEIDDVFLK